MVDRGKLSSAYMGEVERFNETHPNSARHFEVSKKSLLSGVPMAWMNRWPGPHPIFAVSASGATVTDVDGNQYIDFALGDTGAMVGHTPAYLSELVQRQVTTAITTMLPSPDAAWVASELTRRFSLPKWQFAMTATDANRFALRLARHLTGRTRILVFDWCYHGTVDETLVTLDSAGKVVPRAGNLGPGFKVEESTRVVQFNDLEALERELAFGDVAAVLTEPALTNIGIVLPESGFHDGLRRLTKKYGTLLIIDETHTICVGPGGYTAAHGLEPDMLTIGKPIGGGIPAAAFGVSAELEERLRPTLEDESIDVSGIGGTLTGNALAVAAMKATLSNSLLESDFAVSGPLAKSWAEGVQTTIDRHDLPWSVQNLGSRSEYWFCPSPKNGAQAAAAVDLELDRYFHLFALNRGILLTPFHNMALFSPKHTANDVQAHTGVFAETVESIL